MAMKLKIQHLMDATLVISQIIREERPLPQKGKYRLARMHPKLNAEFLIINAQRDEAIKKYDYHIQVPNPKYNPEIPLAETLKNNVTELQPKTIPSEQFYVPPDKLEEFEKFWLEIAEQDITVEVEPIPLSQLCFSETSDMNGSISAHEFIVLGDLVTE